MPERDAGGRARPPLRGPPCKRPPLEMLTAAQLYGEAVRTLRRGRRLRLVDLAERADVSVGRLSQIETGEYAAWRRSTDRVARALNFRDALALLRAFYGGELPGGVHPPEGPPGPAKDAPDNVPPPAPRGGRPATPRKY